MMKWILGFIIAIFILIVVVFLLTSTTSGLNMSLQLVKKLIPGELNYSTVSEIPNGSIKNGSIAIVKFSYHYQGFKITIKKLHLAWNPLSLLAGIVHITHLNAENVKIILPPFLGNTHEKEKINPLAQKKLPLFLKIEAGYIKHMSIDRKKEASPMLIKNIWFNQVNIKHSLFTVVDAEIIQPFVLNIHISAINTFDHYHFFLTIKNSDFNWRINGKGTYQWVELKMHETHTLDGYFNAFMKINFEPVLQWRMNICIAHLNLRHLYKNWPQQLTLQLSTTGRYEIDQFFNFTFSGVVQTSKAYFHIIGQHQKNWDLNWNINISNFSSLFATTSGILKGQGSVTGPTRSPLIIGNLVGKNINLPHYHATELNGHWYLDTSLNQASTAKFNAYQLVAHFFQISRLKINVNEKPHAHQISIETLIDDKKFGKIVIYLLLHGNVKNKVWRGILERFNIYSEKFGKWHIKKRAIVAIAFDHAIVTLLYLHSHNDLLCLHGEWVKQSFVLINGTIAINSINRFPIRMIFPNTIQTYGCLKCNFEINRSFKKYHLINILKLEQSHIEFPAVKVDLTRVHVFVDATSSQINYQLDGYSQNQLVQIIGQTRLDLPGYPTIFTLRGKNILLINTHQYIIYGTANLKIDIRDQDIGITGILTIPKAILKPTTFSHSITITHDVVYVGQKTQKRFFPWKIHMNVKIKLGNQIFLDSLGIKIHFVGGLTLFKVPFQPLIANGRIIVADGTFTTHRHALDITPNSSISFIQSPINNPILNVRAIRTLKPLSITPQISNQIITIGIDIEGNLYHPEVKLYSSDPNLTQADISSYLIFGHPATISTPDNINLFINAIDTLKIMSNQTSISDIIHRITQELGFQGLGFTELGIESQTTTLLETFGTQIPLDIKPIQSTFVIGHCLLQHLYIRYSRGITIPINIVQFRYLIDKKWAIQTEATSERSGGDILYTIERN